MPLTLEAKPGVKWDVHWALDQIQDVIAAHYVAAGSRAVVTSARDGHHSAHSAHCEGRGIDLRITHLYGRKPILTGRDWWRMVLEFAGGLAENLERAVMLRGLPGRFDVVLEASPPHLHMEFTEIGSTPNIVGWKPAQRIYTTREVNDLLVSRVA